METSKSITAHLKGGTCCRGAHRFIVLPQLTSLWPYKRGGGGKGRVFFLEGELSMYGGKLQMEGSHLRAGEDGERKSFRWAPGRPLYHEREVAYG